MAFDVAIGLRRDVLERAFEKLYTQLYPRYFKDFVPADGGRNIVYDVKSAPTLDFSPTPATAALLREELAKVPQPESSSISPSLLTANVASIEMLASSIDLKTLKLVFNSIDITIKSTRPDAKSSAKVVVWLTYEIEYPAGQPPRGSFKAKRIQITASNPEDQFIFDKFLGPVMLKLAAQLLSAVQIPGMIDIAGNKFDLPEPRIIGDHLVILAKLPNNYLPLGLDASMPGGNPEAFTLLSPDIVTRVFKAATRDLTHPEEKIDSVDLGISTAWYHARIVVSDIQGTPGGAEFPISASVRGLARGWITTFMGNPEANFSATPIPSPVTGRIAFSAGAKNKIVAKVTDVAPFTIDIKPVDGAAKVIEFVLWPLILFAKLAVGGIGNYLASISFDVWTVPDLSVSYEGVRFTLGVKDLQLSTSGKYLLATGTVQL